MIMAESDIYMYNMYILHERNRIKLNILPYFDFVW